MKRSRELIALMFFCFVMNSCGGSGGSDDGSGPGEHHILYEVTGGMGTIPSAGITYIDGYGAERTIENAPLPWRFSFQSSPDDILSLAAILHGSGTNTLYVTITVDNECYVENRTFVTESPTSISGTAEDILTECPNNVP